MANWEEPLPNPPRERGGKGNADAEDAEGRTPPQPSPRAGRENLEFKN